MKRSLDILFCTAFIIVSFLWLSSYTHHSSVGIDHDIEKQDRILHMFYRVNWTGHGAILIGYGGVWRDVDGKPLEKFDPAASFLRLAQKPLEKGSLWNRLGFWYVNSSTPRPTFWIGIPSYLPVLVLGLLLFFRSNSRWVNLEMLKTTNRK